MPEIRGLTLTQPWATLVAIGAKKYETRSWTNPYRGLIAIHAAKGFPRFARQCVDSSEFREALGEWGVTRPLPRGGIVAVARLVDIHSTNDVEVSDQERMFGDFSPSRYAWELEDVIRLDEPIPCRGSLSLWHVEYDLRRKLDSQMGWRE